MGRNHHGSYLAFFFSWVPLTRHQISGGTGITPFCQLIHKELLSQSSPNTKTRFTLLHSSRRPIELPPSEILGPLIFHSRAHPDKLRLSLFVDESEGPAHPAVPSSSLTVGRIDKEVIERAMGSGNRSRWRGLFGVSSKPAPQEGGDGQKTVMFLVCGPDSCVPSCLVECVEADNWRPCAAWLQLLQDLTVGISHKGRLAGCLETWATMGNQFGSSR